MGVLIDHQIGLLGRVHFDGNAAPTSCVPAGDSADS